MVALGAHQYSRCHLEVKWMQYLKRRQAEMRRRAANGRKASAIPSGLQLQAMHPFCYILLFSIAVTRPMPKEHTTEALFPNMALMTDRRLANVVTSLLCSMLHFSDGGSTP